MWPKSDVKLSVDASFIRWLFAQSNLVLNSKGTLLKVAFIWTTAVHVSDSQQIFLKQMTCGLKKRKHISSNVTPSVLHWNELWACTNSYNILLVITPFTVGCQDLNNSHSKYYKLYMMFPYISLKLEMNYSSSVYCNSSKDIATVSLCEFVYRHTLYFYVCY